MSDDKQRIFREVALERLASPEQLDLLLKVTSPMSWLALVGLGSLVIMAVIWSVVGTIPTEITEPTILLKGGGVKNILSTYEGQVVALFINENDVVAEGDIIATISPIGTSDTFDVVSPYTGRILGLKADTGTLVRRGDALASLEFVGEDVALEAILYLPPSEGKMVQPGMAVKIAPVTVHTEEFGYLLGSVKSVGEFPSTYEEMVLTLGSDDLIQALDTAQAPIEVRVSLQEDGTTASGYRWSASDGPVFQMSSGTLGTATVTVERQRPIELFLPLR